ncbi:MAG: hypothetical protein WA174_07640 [Rhodoferax sp.]
MAAQKTQTTDGVTSTGAPLSDLDALDGLAASVDGEHLEVTAEGIPHSEVPAPTNYALEASATVDTFAALLVGYCPDTASLWTDDKKIAVAAALAPVMEKYGFTLGALPVELVLIMTAGPLLYQSAKLVAAQMKREQIAAQAAAKPKAQDVPGAVTNGPEVVRHPQAALYK